MTMRPELKTWRFLNAAHGALVQCRRAAVDDDLQGLVGYQITEAGLYLAAALATLELHRDDDPADAIPTPATVMALTVHEVDALTAVLTGAVQRTPAEAELVVDLLNGLRDRFLEQAIEMRKDAGLPVD